MFSPDFLPASCGTVLNSTHARILFICCLTWTSWRIGQQLERCVNVSVDKGVSLSPGGITVCMQTSLSNHVLVCRPTGRGDTGSPQREIWLWQLRIPIQTRQEQTYSQLLRNTHTHSHTVKQMRISNTSIIHINIYMTHTAASACMKTNISLTLPAIHYISQLTETPVSKLPLMPTSTDIHNL